MSSIQAQQEKSTLKLDSYSVGLKMGFRKGVAVGVGSDFIKKNWVSTIDYYISKRYPFLTLNRRKGNQQELNGLFGYFREKGKWSMQLQIGVGVLRTYDYKLNEYEENGIEFREKDDERISWGFNVPFKLKIRRTLGNHVAIGLENQLNVNNLSPSHSSVLTLEFGLFRREKSKE